MFKFMKRFKALEQRVKAHDEIITEMQIKFKCLAGNHEWALIPDYGLRMLGLIFPDPYLDKSKPGAVRCKHCLALPPLEKKKGMK